MTDFPLIQSLYTDGACSGNPGPGGWAAVVYFADGSVHELGGGDRQTTNNRMEMRAAIAALQFLSESHQSQPVSLFTDSEYVMKGITQWIHGWKKKGWKTAGGKPVVNQDLWETLDQLNSRQVSWNYVRGHTGDPGNERCDAIARAFSLNQSISLRQCPLPQPSAASPADSPENHEFSSTETVQSRHSPAALPSPDPMIDASSPSALDTSENLPREVRVSQLRHTLESLQMADEIASRGYLITSSELADLMDVNASAVTSRGDNWVWRNWVVSRVRREGNQILWQLERVD